MCTFCTTYSHVCELDISWKVLANKFCESWKIVEFPESPEKLYFTVSTNPVNAAINHWVTVCDSTGTWSRLSATWQCGSYSPVQAHPVVCPHALTTVYVVQLNGEVLAWLSVWSEVQMICIWSSWCHCHHINSCFSKIQMVYLSDAGLPKLFWKRDR